MNVKKLIAATAAVVMLVGCMDVNPIAVTSAPVPTPAVTETPAPTPEPTPIPTTMPEPTPEPYFTTEEQVTADAENGYWFYSSPTLWVEINRVFDEENTITYFAAEIRVKPGETERAGFSNPDRPGRSSGQLWEIAQAYDAVIAINGDYMNSNGEDPKGIIIRDGNKYLDDDEEDTLAFFPDGTMRVMEPGETTADALLAEGVKNAFSFGPTLIKDGVVEDGLEKHRLRSKNPRSAVGMIEPYHYMLVVVDGRDASSYSSGMTLQELAELFQSYGCEVAYNFDGGASATMAFMGEHISQYAGEHYGQRSVPDALMFGESAFVLDEEP